VSLPTTPCGRCGRPVSWCVSTNGNRIPLDPEPNESGNMIVAYRDGKLVGLVPHKDEPRPEGVGYMPHFATCPILNRPRKGATKPKEPKPCKPPVEEPPTLFG